MALLRFPELRQRFGEPLEKSLQRRTAAQKQLITESKLPIDTAFDVFLSHSYADAQQVLLLKRALEDHQLTVYVDWLVDEELDRASVTPATARRLRTRLEHSRSLLVATSENSTKSIWIPWELGFADGCHGRVAILPGVESMAQTSKFVGQEYMGLYPYVDEAPAKGGDAALWVNETPDVYISISEWFKGKAPFKR